MAGTASSTIDYNITAAFADSRTELIESAIRHQISAWRPGVESVNGSNRADPDDSSCANDAALTEGLIDVRLAVPNLTFRKRIARSVLLPLQEWEGYVTAIHDHSFTAQLVDLTQEDDVPAEEADFELADLSAPDLRLLREGAVFRWTIGYLKSASGSKKRVSQIVFRQLPQWTRREIAAADREAEDILSAITWE